MSSLFGGGGGGGAGIIGQTLGLTRGSTVAPQNVPSAPVNSQNSNTAATFEMAVASQINSVGFQFKPCIPPNQTVAQKTLNNKQTEVASYLCCITGVDQFQQSCIFEIALNDRRLIRQGGVQPPSGNLGQIGFNLNSNVQPGAPTTIGGGGGLFGGNPANPTPGLFGANPAPTTNTATGGLFGGATTTGAATGGLFGTGAPTTTPIGGGGGLFGGMQTQAPLATGGGGLFGTTPAPTTTGGGLFGMNPQPTATGGGLFGANTTQNTGGGLLGGNQPGGLFGGGLNTQNQNKGGLFGAPTTQGGLFGQQPAQQQPMGLFGQQQLPQGQINNQSQSINEMVEEIRRIEQVKTFTQNRKKEEEGMKNRKFATDKNHINHINYLKSQQQKRNVFQWYTVYNKNANKFIEAPYTVKVNVSWDNVKRNEWQILQRSQDIKNQTYLNMGGEQRILYPQSNFGNTSLFYNQLRQLECASYQYTNKSIESKEKEYKKEQLESFSQTSYFKKMEPTVSQDQERQSYFQAMNDDNDSNGDNYLKKDSIHYHYEQSLKNTIKTFNTTVCLRIYEDQEPIIIPIQVKSTYTIQYLLTLVFDFIEENYNIDPSKLEIYQRNYVLYQPLDIEHLIQVRKDNLISEIEMSQMGQIGHFEVVYFDYNDADEIEDEADYMDEEDENFVRRNDKNLENLPIIPNDYFIEPSLQELMTKTTEQLKHFKNFKIGNEYAEICFEGEIDLNGRDFSKELRIDENEIIIYPYLSSDEPPIKPGHGINVQATIKRFNAAQMLLQNEKFDIQKIERRIRKIANQYDMEVIEPYNQKENSFTVRIKHF